MADRKAITIQCVYGEDDDLIKWYTSIEKGERAPIVKKALRSGLGMEITGTSIATIADVKSMLDEFADDFATDVKEWVLSELQNRSFIAENGEETISMEVVKETLDRAAIEKRLNNIKKEDNW